MLFSQSPTEQIQLSAHVCHTSSGFLAFTISLQEDICFNEPCNLQMSFLKKKVGKIHNGLKGNDCFSQMGHFQTTILALILYLSLKR